MPKVVCSARPHAPRDVTRFPAGGLSQVVLEIYSLCDSESSILTGKDQPGRTLDGQTKIDQTACEKLKHLNMHTKIGGLLQAMQHTLKP